MWVVSLQERQEHIFHVQKSCEGKKTKFFGTKKLGEKNRE